MEPAKDLENPRIEMNTTFVEDDTAFFHDIQIVDDNCHIVKNVNGEEIRLEGCDEVVVEPYQVYLQTSYPSTSQRQVHNSTSSDFETDGVEEIEVARGYGTESMGFYPESDPVISLRTTYEKITTCDDAKVEEFYNNLKMNPVWARSLSYVKLNATVSKHLQEALITHSYLKVNERPRYLIMLTKSMAAKDITRFVKMAFESDEIPIENSLFRLYCRNAVPTLKSLLRAVLNATAMSPAIEVEYSDVLGEIVCDGKRVRMKTSDLRSFCKVEEAGQAIGIRFLTTLSCRSRESNDRTLDIRYYDELKKDVRVTYVHLDHHVRNCQRSIQIGQETSEHFFSVDSPMTPLYTMYPPVLDLVKTIVKLSVHLTKCYDSRMKAKKEQSE